MPFVQGTETLLSQGLTVLDALCLRLNNLKNKKGYVHSLSATFFAEVGTSGFFFKPYQVSPAADPSILQDNPKKYVALAPAPWSRAPCEWKPPYIDLSTPLTSMYPEFLRLRLAPRNLHW